MQAWCGGGGGGVPKAGYLWLLGMEDGSAAILRVYEGLREGSLRQTP